MASNNTNQPMANCLKQKNETSLNADMILLYT